MTRLPGLRPSRCAGGLRGLSKGHPALTTNWPASMPATLRAIPPPARRVIRGPDRELDQEPGSAQSLWERTLCATATPGCTAS